MSERDCGTRPLPDDASCRDSQDIFENPEGVLTLIQRMKDKGQLLALKVEFEAEGAHLEEAEALAAWAQRVGLPLTVKIGGCEAVTDLGLCRRLGASSVVAPMIESPFALSKFLGAIRRIYPQDPGLDQDQGNPQGQGKVEWVMNLETITAYQQLDQILEAGQGAIHRLNIGRVDLSASLGMTRQQIDDDALLQICLDMAKRGQEAGYAVSFGGGIGLDSIPFIQAMAPYVDRFETRKAVFAITGDEALLKDCIIDATGFELLYLRGKGCHYGGLTPTEQERIDLLQKRLGQVRSGCCYCTVG